MVKPFRYFICVCGLMGMLLPDNASSQAPAPRPVPGGMPRTAPPPDPPDGVSIRYAPLGQVLPRATQESGVQFDVPETIFQEQVPVKESGPDRNLDLGPVLDGFSRIELYEGDSELKKVILLNRNQGGSSQAPVSAPPPALNRSALNKPRPSTRPVPHRLSTTNLSREQLQKLVRGSYRSPLAEELWDNPEYQEFLIGQGILSREEMTDRDKTKKLRRTIRRLLMQLQNKK